MKNAVLYESQAGIKTSRRHSNLRHAYDTTIMAESKEKLKSLLTRVKEESDLKKQGQGIQSHHLMANRRETGNSDALYFGGLQF